MRFEYVSCENCRYGYTDPNHKRARLEAGDPCEGCLTYYESHEAACAWGPQYVFPYKHWYPSDCDLSVGDPVWIDGAISGEGMITEIDYKRHEGEQVEVMVLGERDDGLQKVMIAHTIYTHPRWLEKQTEFMQGLLYSREPKVARFRRYVKERVDLNRAENLAARLRDVGSVLSESLKSPTVEAVQEKSPEQDPYSELERVLNLAYQQASRGKGKERHVQFDGERFEDQQILEITRRVGGGGPAFQAIKKIIESGDLSHEAAMRELLGAIVYTAALYLYREEESKRDKVPE